MLVDAVLVDAPATPEVVEMLQDEVVGHRQVTDQARMPVLRDAPDARPHHSGRIGACQLDAVDGDRSTGRFAHAGKQLDELGLAIARHAGDPQDLAAGDVERDLRQGREPVRPVRVEVADAEDRRAGGRRALGRTFDAEGGTADHHAGQLALVGRPGNRADQPSAAQDADAVADGTHLRQLVADEYDRHPVGHERAQRGEERVHLLRHEDRGRLVEDEDPAVARERLEDLDSLLLPDRQLIHAGRRIDTNPEALRCIGPTAARLVQVETHPARPSEGEVLGDGHRPHQREVLRDHPDAGPDRVARRADGLHLPVDPDLTGIRCVSP